MNTLSKYLREIRMHQELNPSLENETKNSKSKDEMHGIKNKHKDIYKKYPQQYDLLMSKQDYNNNLVPFLLMLASSHNIRNEMMLELGSGTGKLSSLLGNNFRFSFGIDSSAQMVKFANAKFKNSTNNCEFIVGDFRNIPFKSNSFSTVVAGWAFSYLKVNYQYTELDVEAIIGGVGTARGEKKGTHITKDTTIETPTDVRNGWAFQLRKTLRECKRVLLDDGTLIILESRGIAYDEPTRDGSWYYKYLNYLGFKHSVIRTDYKQEAESSTKFFFGKVVENRVKTQNSCIVTEHTGVWWIHKKDLELKVD